jgi:tripartite-type tricarboxylate transporter receptor subunit TctC
MASGGIGSLPHVAGELFKFMTGINLVHVPYRGSYLPDLLGGQVQIAFGPIPTLIEQIRAGKLGPLAVTGADTSEALPDLPTLGQFVRGYEASAFNGVGAPKKTPGVDDAQRIRQTNRMKATNGARSLRPRASKPNSYQ